MSQTTTEPPNNQRQWSSGKLEIIDDRSKPTGQQPGMGFDSFTPNPLASTTQQPQFTSTTDNLWGNRNSSSTNVWN